MSTWIIAAELAAALLLAGAILINLRALRAVRALLPLNSIKPGLKSWPRVSIVAAACDEADTIGGAAETLLQMDYPNLEVVLVNDRSTDGTSEIIDSLAKTDSRVRAVHITELPEGWLGKLHGLHRGTEVSTGDFIVYTDADVHFEPTMLRRAVTLCEEEGLGHLAVLPMTRGDTLAADAVIAAFATGFLNAFDFATIGREGSDEVVGVGAFGMIRRRDFDRTPGWPWLKMEILDDLGLAMMMNKGGAKSAIVTGEGQLSLTWYPNLPALVRGLEKNAFIGLSNLSLARSALTIILLPALVAAFFFAFAASAVWLKLIGTLLLATLLLMAHTFRVRIHHPPAATILSFFILPVLSWAVLRSTFKTIRQGGVDWRGTHYALDDLRAGKRTYL